MIKPYVRRDGDRLVWVGGQAGDDLPPLPSKAPFDWPPYLDREATEARLRDPYDLPTGSYDPSGDSRLIFLAGAVTYWWNENWDTPERRAYHAWRQRARYALIEAGYITYAPHEAIKGPWNPRMQNINNIAIFESSGFIVLSPRDIPSNGTDKEIELAQQCGVPVAWAAEENGIDYLLTVAGLCVATMDALDDEYNLR